MLLGQWLEGPNRAKEELELKAKEKVKNTKGVSRMKYLQMRSQRGCQC